MALTRPTLSELRTRILNDILSRVTPGVGILKYALLKIQAVVWGGAVYLLWGAIIFLSKMAFIQTAVNEFLFNHGNKWVGDKLQPTTASGNYEFTGVVGTLVPSGTAVQDPAGLKYDTQANLTLTGTDDIVEIVSQETGLEQNQSAGTVLSLVTPITDIDNEGTVQSGGLTGGTDLESDEDYRARIIDHIQNAPMGGNVNDYKQWVKEALSSATRIWVKPQLSGPGTVGIYFVKDNDPISIIPGPGDLTTVNSYIQDPKRKPAIANPTALAPVLSTITFTIQYTPFIVETQAKITESLEAMFLRDGEPEGVLKISRIKEAISVAPGEEDHRITAIAVDGGGVAVDQDIQLGAGKLPEVGTITYQELS